MSNVCAPPLISTVSVVVLLSAYFSWTLTPPSFFCISVSTFNRPFSSSMCLPVGTEDVAGARGAGRVERARADLVGHDAGAAVAQRDDDAARGESLRDASAGLVPQWRYLEHYRHWRRCPHGVIPPAPLGLP